MFFKNKKDKAYEKYVLENKEKFYRIAFIYTKNREDSLDVVQDSIIKGYEKVDSIKDMESLDKWFVRIVVNTSLDLIRKRSKLSNLEDSHLEDLKVDESFEENNFNEIINNLDEELKGIITLKYFNGYKIKEISEILVISESQVKNKMHKALNLLRKDLKEEVI